MPEQDNPVHLWSGLVVNHNDFHLHKYGYGVLYFLEAGLAKLHSGISEDVSVHAVINTLGHFLHISRIQRLLPVQ